MQERETNYSWRAGTNRLPRRGRREIPRPGGLVVQDHPRREDQHEDEPQVKQQVVEDHFTHRGFIFLRRLSAQTSPRALFAEKVPVDGSDGKQKQYDADYFRDDGGEIHGN